MHYSASAVITVTNTKKQVYFFKTSCNGFYMLAKRVYESMLWSTYGDGSGESTQPSSSTGTETGPRRQGDQKRASPNT